jgi:triacylglycerol esterase/lipase EstA (alpha/beta hydrolase family)
MFHSPGTGFDLPAAPAPPIRIPIDYGQYINLPTLPPHSTKQAVVLGALPPNWTWSADNPVHMICHSQGGNTVRLLITLLSGMHGRWNPAYFKAGFGNRQKFIRAVVTLGTPYLGTTITDVIFNVSL